jgi:hypothetical protein
MKSHRIALRVLSVIVAAVAIGCGGTPESETGGTTAEERKAYTFEQSQQQLPPGTVSQMELDTVCSETPDKCCTGTFCCTWIAPGLPPTCG